MPTKHTNSLQKVVKEMKEQVNDLQKSLQAQAVKDAETKGKAMGYDVGRTDKQAGH